MTPILGTAMWGWTTPKEKCFELLDYFYEKGFREVDGATNYPINKNPKDFRRAEKILQEWIKVNGIRDLKVMIKVGSLNNMRTPEHNLSESFLLIVLEEYQVAFGENLDTFMIHWDNRSEKEEIEKSYKVFQKAQNQGLRVGLSGIKHPDLHKEVNQSFDFDFRIQMKHNLLYSDYKRYAPFHGKKRFIAYGINAGGIKLDKSIYDKNSSLKARGGDIDANKELINKLHKVIESANKNGERPKLSSFNHLGMIYAFYQKDMEGILLGTSKVEQLSKSVSFLDDLNKYNFSDVNDTLLNSM